MVIVFWQIDPGNPLGTCFIRRNLNIKIKRRRTVKTSNTPHTSKIYSRYIYKVIDYVLSGTACTISGCHHMGIERHGEIMYCYTFIDYASEAQVKRLMGISCRKVSECKGLDRGLFRRDRKFQLRVNWMRPGRKKLNARTYGQYWGKNITIIHKRHGKLRTLAQPAGNLLQEGFNIKAFETMGWVRGIDDVEETEMRK